MSETRTITYRGSPNLVGLLVHGLEEQGLDVRWQSPVERRGVGRDTIELVVIPIVVTGAYDLMKVAISRFLARFPKAGVDVDEDDD